MVILQMHNLGGYKCTFAYLGFEWLNNIATVCARWIVHYMSQESV